MLRAVASSWPWPLVSGVKLAARGSGAPTSRRQSAAFVVADENRSRHERPHRGRSFSQRAATQTTQPPGTRPGRRGDPAGLDLFQQAEPEARAGLALDANLPWLHINLGGGFYNLAGVHALMGREEEAITALERDFAQSEVVHFPRSLVAGGCFHMDPSPR